MGHLRRYKRQPKILPLQDLPLRISIGDVEVTGKILTLYPNDIEVALDSGEHRGLHIPYFAIGRGRVATAEDGATSAITPYGQELAERLLRQLHQTKSAS